jgi:hypothetical protein
LPTKKNKKQATGTPIGVILQSINTLVISIGLSIFYQWKLGLSISTFVPLVLVSFYFQTKIVMGQDTIEKSAFEASAKVKSDKLTNDDFLL